MSETSFARRHLYLTGYRGTGKTVVGDLLARRLGRDIIDLDQVVEETNGKSIREIFEIGGEGLFRKLETEALQRVSQRSPAVISLGGGTILSETNRNLIGVTGLCVWLKAEAETIAARIDADATSRQRRPALTSLDRIEEIRQVLSDRLPLYQAVSDHIVDTENSDAKSVAEEIGNWLTLRHNGD